MTGGVGGAGTQEGAGEKSFMCLGAGGVGSSVWSCPLNDSHGRKNVRAKGLLRHHSLSIVGSSVLRPCGAAPPKELGWMAGPGERGGLGQQNPTRS